MEFSEALASRRSVRSYTGRPVEESTLRELLRAAVQAPSAMNRQPWAFTIVQNAATLARWSERAKTRLLDATSNDAKTSHYAQLLRDPNFNIFYDAGTLVVIGVTEPGRYADADCWLAAENLMLAAHAAGLGTCPIGFALSILDTPELKDELGFPDSGRVVAAIIVGYPRNTPAPVPRSEPRILSWLR